MPIDDPNSAGALTAFAGMGAAAGTLGGVLVALLKAATPRQMAAAIIGAFSLGGAVGATASAWSGLGPAFVLIGGFVAGLSIFGFLSGIWGLSDKFGKNPSGVLANLLPDALKRFVPPEDKQEGGK